MRTARTNYLSPGILQGLMLSDKLDFDGSKLSEYIKAQRQTQSERASESERVCFL